jgi:hypothetical protein
MPKFPIKAFMPRPVLLLLFELLPSKIATTTILGCLIGCPWCPLCAYEAQEDFHVCVFHSHAFNFSKIFCKVKKKRGGVVSQGFSSSFPPTCSACGGWFDGCCGGGGIPPFGAGCASVELVRDVGLEVGFLEAVFTFEGGTLGSRKALMSLAGSLGFAERPRFRDSRLLMILSAKGRNLSSGVFDCARSALAFSSVSTPSQRLSNSARVCNSTFS